MLRDQTDVHLHKNDAFIMAGSEKVVEKKNNWKKDISNVG
jgi:hypothetical protein